jgi:uncharacterized protein YodC (DUF2158 family)
MSAEQIEEGDIVQLKSGGPAMTVLSVEQSGYLLCKWFDDKSKSHHEQFPPRALRKIPEDTDDTPFIPFTVVD